MTTPKKKMPWWMGLLIIIGSFMLLGIVAIGAFVWWLSANKDRLAADGKEALAEAEEYAESHDQNACIDEGLRKLSACDGFMCEATVKVFASTCIRRAERTPGFCEGVPSLGEFIKTSRWVSEECKRRGKPNNQRCQRLVQSVPEACRAASAR